MSGIALIYADMPFEHAFDLRSEHFLTSKQMTTLSAFAKAVEPYDSFSRRSNSMFLFHTTRICFQKNTFF